MADFRQQALDYHEYPTPGKISLALTTPAETAEDLALAYSPGVAEPVREIAANPDDVSSTQTGRVSIRDFHHM